jgi:hypothetical protein|tara:strand:+ start:969 stop:1202 length:234 start_codon:yes stop_codon:yes gene_type:complete
MSKKEKEPTYNLFGKEYTQSELDALDDEQKGMIQHRDDLLNKINRAEFNLIQLRFGLKAFDDGLVESGMEVVESNDE